MSSRKRSASVSGGNPKASRLASGRPMYLKPSNAVQRSYGSRMLAAVQQRKVELKGVDFSLNNGTAVPSTTNTNAVSIVLNLIQQGAGSWNRIGRKVCLKSLRLRGTVHHEWNPVATTAASSGNVMRMVVVWDKQPSGAAIPTYDTIFGRTIQDGTESCSFLDGLRYDNTDRFSVLRDETFYANPQTALFTGTTNTNFDVYPFDIFIPLKDRETVFLGQSAPMTIADISTGAIYVFYRAAIDSVNNFMSVGGPGVARLRYIDP